VRDVRVRVDGEVLASDDIGRIDLPSSAGEVEVVVLGYDVSPPVRQVRFVQWADGDPSSVRRIDLTSPVPDLELQVLHRVEVVASGVGLIRFDSSAGPVELTPGVPAWVPAIDADSEGLISYQRADSSTDETFLPSPEARWFVV